MDKAQLIKEYEDNKLNFNKLINGIIEICAIKADNERCQNKHNDTDWQQDMTAYVIASNIRELK